MLAGHYFQGYCRLQCSCNSASTNIENHNSIITIARAGAEVVTFVQVHAAGYVDDGTCYSRRLSDADCYSKRYIVLQSRSNILLCWRRSAATASSWLFPTVRR